MKILDRSGNVWTVDGKPSLTALLLAQGGTVVDEPVDDLVDEVVALIEDDSEPAND